MNSRRYVYGLMVCAIAACMLWPAEGRASTSTNTSGHRTITDSVLSEQSGSLTVKTEDGSQLNLATSASRRHGHAVPKVGEEVTMEEVTMIVDENNTVIDVQPKGQEGTHSFVTGKLEYVGKM